MSCRVGNYGCPGRDQRTHRLTAAGQAGKFDALHEVVLADGERASPTWLAGFEAHIMENVVVVITRARKTWEGGLAAPPRRGLRPVRRLRASRTVDRLNSYAMTQATVLAQTESVADWVKAIGQAVGSIGTITVAIVALRWDHRERRDRKTAQATFVTIEVDCVAPWYKNDAMSVTITNHSEQAVLQPKIESMGAARPPVQWGWDQVRLVDDDGEEYGLRRDDMLLPRMSTRVPFQHFDADGRPISLLDIFWPDPIEKCVQVSDVKITFGMSGVWWRLTGNGEPVRVAQPAPTQRL